MTTEFDLNKTALLAELASQPSDSAGWSERFLAAVPHAALTSPQPQALKGPDGFPYVRLALPKLREQFASFSVAHVAPFCTRDGFGAVVLPSLESNAPLWVFSYGDLCSWQQFGSFGGDPADRDKSDLRGVEVVAEERQVLVGAPSEELLPSYARAIIGRYLVSAGVPQPAVKLVMDGKSRQLMVNFGRAEFPDRARLDGVMHRLSWFLPRGRTLMLRVDELAGGEWTPLAGPSTG